jgi:hypothetical protein
LKLKTKVIANLEKEKEKDTKNNNSENNRIPPSLLICFECDPPLF